MAPSTTSLHSLLFRLCFFAGLGFLTFYVAGKLHLWDKVGSAVSSGSQWRNLHRNLISTVLHVHVNLERDETKRQVKSWITITPLVGAALVAITRTMDSRRTTLALPGSLSLADSSNSPQIIGKMY